MSNQSPGFPHVARPPPISARCACRGSWGRVSASRGRRSAGAVERGLFRSRVVMLRLAALVLLWGFCAPLDEKDECVFEFLNGPDANFCRGGLEVIYPELDASCAYIPSCTEYRQSIMSEWGPPLVKFPYARMDKKYVLIMVDPDAPSRADPKFQYWRHWLVTDIKGQDLIEGQLHGKTLSDYRRPTPPANSGYHRYQLYLYEQPEEKEIELSNKERGTFGSWDMDKFVKTFHLGSPETTTQFLTKNV